MKGFILHITQAKDEDIILTILTPNRVIDYYRFYGSRHSVLQLGYLIDFEEEESRGRFLPRLRGVTHIGFSWLIDMNRLMIWHKLIKLFHIHLRDTEDIDSFYFDILLNSTKKWSVQNPKRIVCEVAYSVLEYEGRLYPAKRCYICNGVLGEKISLMSALKLAHPECIYAPYISFENFKKFFESGKTTWLDDKEVNVIYSSVIKGF